MTNETSTYRIVDATTGHTVYRDLEATNERSAVLRFRRRCFLAHNYPHVVAVVQAPAMCALCGESYDSHRAASANTAPYCTTKHTRYGDMFVRDLSKGGAR